jgi:hypothetical protein
VTVMDDLVADIDRRAKGLERPLDDLDGPYNTGTESPWLSQYNSHACPNRFVPAEFLRIEGIFLPGKQGPSSPPAGLTVLWNL